MSLRARVAALVGCVLLGSIVGGLLLSGFEARRTLREELAAAMTGGRQTIASAFEDLPRSDHPARDLHQLVSTFDGNRHVRAALVGPDGVIRDRSSVSVERSPAPAWFARLLSPATPPSRIAVPATVSVGGSILLQPSADLDIRALWAEALGLAAVLATAFAIGLVGVYWAIGRGLRPLTELSGAFRSLGGGDFSGRVTVRGPSELLLLERGFNAMVQQLQEANERNQGLELQLLTIQDEERAELARDLHDEIGPHLFAVNVDAEMIGQLTARTPDGDKLSDHVGSIRRSVAHMQRLVRDILGRLRPLQAAELGLNASLEELAGFWRGRSPGLELRLNAPPEADELPEALKDTLYRVAQEAVSNAMRHAQAARIDVDLTLQSGAAVLRIVNDGAPVPSKGTGGFGLVGMRERVAACAGALSIEQRGGEWTVTARLPAPAIREAAE